MVARAERRAAGLRALVGFAGLLLALTTLLIGWPERGHEPAPPQRRADSAALGGAAEPGGAVRDRLAASGVPSGPPATEPPGGGRTEVRVVTGLVARVLDVARRPVSDVPVSLGTLDEVEQHQGFVARSDVDGMTRFPPEVLSGRTTGPLALRIAVPGAARPVRVDRDAPPREPVELIAPSLGRLVVSVRTARGEPVAADGMLELFAWPAGEAPPADLRSASFPFQFSLTGPGELVVDPIAVGLEVSVEAWLAEYAAGSVQGGGPARAGETMRLAIEIPRYGPIVVGRLVAPGRTAVHGRFSGRVIAEADRGIAAVGVTFATDATGHFRFDASGFAVGDPDRPRWLEIAAAQADGGGVAGRARVALPVPFVDGEYDVGDVSYDLASVLISGRVEDCDGRPVAAAWVSVSRSLADPSDRLSQPVGADGVFAIRSFGDAESLVVVASDARGRESEPVRVARGASGIRLVVRDTGTIEGVVQPAADVEMRQITLLLSRSGQGVLRGDRYAPISPSSSGAFRWSRVAPGSVDVAIALGHAGAMPDVVAVVTDVEVRSGESVRDPRLARVDLAAYLGRSRVEVVDPAGSPVPTGTVTLLAAGGSGAEVLTVPLHAGIAIVPTARSGVDVDIRAPGFLRERARGLGSSARITLRRSVPVVLELAPALGGDLGGGRIELRMLLFAVDDDDRQRSPQGVVLDRSGAGRIVSHDAGWQRVRLEVRPTVAAPAAGTDAAIRFAERWEELGRRLAVAFGEPRVLIAEGVGEQHIVVPLTPAARTVLEQAAQVPPER